MTPQIGRIVLFTSGLGTTDLDPIDPATGAAFAGSTGAVNPATGQRFDSNLPVPRNPASGFPGGDINPLTGQRFDAAGQPLPNAGINPATGQPFPAGVVNDPRNPINPSTGSPLSNPAVPSSPNFPGTPAADATVRAAARAKAVTKASPAPADQVPNQFPGGPFPVNPATGQPFRDADINPATNQRFDAAGPINASLPSTNLDPVTGKVFVGSNVNPVNLNPATGQPFTGTDVNPATGQRFDVGVPNPVITPVTSQPRVRGPFNTGPATPPFTAPQSRFTLPPEVAPAIITAVNQDGTVALCVFYRGGTVNMDSVAHALIPGAPNDPPLSGEWQPAAGSPGALGMWQWPPK